MGSLAKLLLLFSVVLLALALESLGDLQDRALDEKWKNYKIKHGKTYENKAEEGRRRKIYEANVKNIIETHKLQGLQGRRSSFSLGENALTDMTKEERQQLKQLKAPRTKLSPRWNNNHNPGNGGSSSSSDEDYYDSDDESTTTTKSSINSNAGSRQPSNSVKASDVPDSV